MTRATPKTSTPLVIALTTTDAQHTAHQHNLHTWQAVTPHNYRTILTSQTRTRQNIYWPHTTGWEFTADLLAAVRQVINRSL